MSGWLCSDFLEPPWKGTSVIRIMEFSCRLGKKGYFMDPVWRPKRTNMSKRLLEDKSLILTISCHFHQIL